MINDPDAVALMVQHELVDPQDAIDAQEAFNTFLDELEKEWSPERIKEHLLSEMRAKYARAKKYLSKLELDNRDARVAGMSYKERQTFTVKIRGGQEALKDYVRRGDEIKKTEYTVRTLMPLDMPYVQKEGYEKYLGFTYLF